MKQYFLQLLLALDQLGNVILGGMADETLSSRAYRAWLKQRMFGLWFKPLIDILFFWQEDHCYHSYLSEKKRSHLPTVFRE